MRDQTTNTRPRLHRVTTWMGWGALLLGLVLPILSGLLAMTSASYREWVGAGYAAASRAENLPDMLAAAPVVGLASGLGVLLIYGYLGCWGLRAGLAIYRRLHAARPAAGADQ